MRTDRELPDSPAGRVARNVQDLRDDRRLTVRELSARLAALGVRILPSGITSIEGGDRRRQRGVDADELVALAIALDVTPNRLLLPAQASKVGTVGLTPGVQASEQAAWRWAVGERPLVGVPGSDAAAVAGFAQQNRPHDPPDQTTAQELVDLVDRGDLEPLRKGYAAARAAGLSPGAARAYLQMLDREE